LSTRNIVHDDDDDGTIKRVQTTVEDIDAGCLNCSLLVQFIPPVDNSVRENRHFQQSRRFPRVQKFCNSSKCPLVTICILMRAPSKVCRFLNFYRNERMAGSMAASRHRAPVCCLHGLQAENLSPLSYCALCLMLFSAVFRLIIKLKKIKRQRTTSLMPDFNFVKLF